MRKPVAAVLLVTASPAAAEVVGSNANGFEVKSSVSLAVPVPRAYAAFGKPNAWWSDAHTYSGKAANMTLTLQPGGCFCESVPESRGGVEHMRVAVVQRDQRIVMTGSLGPLLYEGTAGVMDVKFEPSAGGSKVTMNYRAAGFARGNAEKMALLVDAVLAEQLKRFAAYAGK